MHDYAGHYATLGVTPETDWKALRARYRKLVKQWHPDRFSAEGGDKRLAEERTKEITLAYQALERYRREHGTLPPLDRPAVRFETGPGRATTARREPSVEAVRRPIEPKKPKRRSRRNAILLIAAIATAAFVLTDHSRKEPQPEGPVQFENQRPLDAPASSEPTLQSPEQVPGIKIGSTFGEVVSIQGVPSSTQGNTWLYGRSRIRFAEGRVISWEEHPDSPLRIDRRLSTLHGAGLFGVGSTKQEVRAIQGLPSLETETVWQYGASRVHFKDSKVTHWEESPVQPLRAAR